MSIYKEIKFYGIVSNSTKTFSNKFACNVGDVNNDGYEDILIGSPYASPYGRTEAGESYLIFGKAVGWSDFNLNDLTYPQGIKIYGAAAGDHSGWSVSGIGDVNGDRHDDFIIGAPDADPFGDIGAGESYVIFGKNTAWIDIDLNNLIVSQGIKIYGAVSGGKNGFSLSGAGDINCDNHSDILIGAPYAHSSGREEAGETYLIFGKSGIWANLDLTILDSSSWIKIYGETNGSHTGWSVSGVGDINGDKCGDFLIAAPNANPFNIRINAGITYALFGKNTTWENIDLKSLSTEGIKIYGASNGDRSGWSVSGVSDANNDGLNDILISAPYASPLGYDSAGKIYLIFGKTVGSHIDLLTFSNSEGIRMQGVSTGDKAGWSVGSTTFTNGSLAAILIGTPYADLSSYINVGVAYIVFNRGSWVNLLLNDSSIDSIRGTINNSYFGTSINSAGDIDKDGYFDILITTPYANSFGQVNSGEISLIFGNPNIILPSFKPTQTPTILTNPPSISTKLPTEIPTSSPTSLTYVPTLLTKSPTISTAYPTYTPESPTILPTKPEKAGEEPFWEQSLFWEIVGSVTGLIALIVTIIGGLYTYYRKNNENDLTKPFIEMKSPIGISLDASRDIEIIPFNQSKVMFNYTSTLLKTSWVGKKDAILIYDYNKNKIVDNGFEIVLTRWSESAVTDFKALLEVFDSNHDNVFNSQDDKFDQFYIWQDKNQNGISEDGELISLQDVGIKYIDFNTQKESTEAMKKQGILNTAEVHWTSGLVTKAYDLVFEHEA